MSRLIFHIIILTILSLVPNSWAFEIISQSPAFADKVVLTTDPLIVTFDQSLDLTTINPGSFFVELVSSGEVIPGDIRFEQTHQPNDTIVFETIDPWIWGARYQLHVTNEVTDHTGLPLSDSLPDEGFFAANIPNDFALPQWDPADPMSVFIITLDLLGYNPIDPDVPAAPWQVPGSHVTDAWKYDTGRSDVIIAILDTGVDPESPELRQTFFLNRNELPLPNNNGEPCPEYDCNSDDRFNVEDYANDNRLSDFSPVTARSLVEVFSDGVDDDNNGFVDDISGWDFLKDSNDPWCAGEIPTGCHGQWQGDTGVGRANNGFGTRPGVCSGCTLLPLRTSAMVLHGGAEIAAAIKYASMMNASAISLSGVTLTWSAEAKAAIEQAREGGALTVSVSGDEMSFHHWMPGCGENVLNIKTVFPLVPIDLVAGLNLDMIGFTETFATNYGPHVHLSVPSTRYSTSESTSITAGAIGLIFSRALNLGIELSADEVKQILTMTADDVADHCASVFNLFDVCQEGFDEHFGYGRMNLENAMLSLGDPDRNLAPKIPPSVIMSDPKWWQTFDPTITPEIQVSGEITSRVTPYEWELQIAQGHQPLEHEFMGAASVTETGPRTGWIAELSISEFISDQWATGTPENQNTFEVTIRMRASYLSSDNETVVGEDRKTISVHIDRDQETGLMPGFPIDVGSSGESAPLLYDIDGAPDGRLEIILGTGSGMVEVMGYNDESGIWENLPGFPVDLSGSDSHVPDAIFSDLAVGDLFGDGTPEIVVSTTKGLVYALDAKLAEQGSAILPGFPVSADPIDAGSSLAYAFGNGFLAAPVLADLDMDGKLDIIAVSLDQKAYAWSLTGPENHPEMMNGWPVVCRSDEAYVTEDLICENPEFPLPIIASPAVGILDPSNSNTDISDYPAVVIGTNEACADTPLATTRVYAIFHDGNDNPEGPFLPGWPATPLAPLSEPLLALALVAGTSSSPAVYLDESGAQIVTGSTGWGPQVISYENDATTTKGLHAGLQVSGTGSPLIASLNNDERMQIVVPLIGVLRFDELGFQLADSSLMAFDMTPPNQRVLEGRLENLPLLTSVSVADLDGDGKREALAGTGGYITHAYKAGGGEAPGWPKFTHKWMAAAPAVGDIDADGKVEVVAMSREGALYAWNSQGPVCFDDSLNSDWRRNHHDERNTGFYGTDTVPPFGVSDLKAKYASGDNVRLSFTAPGDDWQCGSAVEYDIRHTAEETEDLTDYTQFLKAAPVESLAAPNAAGTTEEFTVFAPDAKIIAIQAIDDSLNRSRIKAANIQEDIPEEDDDDGDDDGDMGDNGKDGDEDEGRCCG